MAGQLSPLARLALAYAPARSRNDWLTLLALDARLAGVVRNAREPMLAQLRLSWWRDRFTADPGGWPKGEPLLGRLALWDQVSALGALVDGWEALLGDPPLGEGPFLEFASGRAKAVGLLASRIGAPVAASELAGRRWALGDLALHIGDPQERAVALNLLAGSGSVGRAPRTMRPLALLAGLPERAIRRGHDEALSGMGALFAAIRLGITGR